MVFDSGRADGEIAGNLLVRFAINQQSGNLLLAGGEFCEEALPRGSAADGYQRRTNNPARVQINSCPHTGPRNRDEGAYRIHRDRALRLVAQTGKGCAKG